MMFGMKAKAGLEGERESVVFRKLDVGSLLEESEAGRALQRG